MQAITKLPLTRGLGGKILLITLFIFYLTALKGQSSQSFLDIQILQEKAIQNSAEIKLLEQAIKTAESKKWTSLAPSITMGNNFAGKADFRLNASWDIAEVLGGGKIRQINLEVARLKFQKFELENQLKIQVLENVLALEKAERGIKRVDDKLDALHKRLDLIKAEYKRGERDLDSLSKYWEKA